MSNYHLNDNKLSLKSKGLMSFMLTKPDDWNFSINGLKSQLLERYDAIRSGLIELEKLGYLRRRKIRDSGGRIIDTEYTIHEKPLSDTDAEPLLDKPLTEIPITGKPLTANHRQVNTNKVNTDLSKYCLKVFNEIVDLFPNPIKTEVEKKKWLDTIDKLNRIDGIDFLEIVAICKKMRADDFWAKNFLSVLKLRRKDKDGILYVKRFQEHIKANEKRISAAATKKTASSKWREMLNTNQ